MLGQISARGKNEKFVHGRLHLTLDREIDGIMATSEMTVIIVEDLLSIHRILRHIDKGMVL